MTSVEPAGTEPTGVEPTGVEPTGPARVDPAGTEPARVEPDISADDLAAVAAQLGRTPRGTRAVAHRCPCDLPDVVATRPRLADGTPFPTLYYLTCPRAVAACGRLEASGLMRQMTERLSADPELASAYQAAHERYLAEREAIEAVPEIAGVSAGGMPTRVKCLHVQLGYALAAGPGVSPFGDEVRDLAGDWWTDGPCVNPQTSGVNPQTPSANTQTPGVNAQTPSANTQAPGVNGQAPSGVDGVDR